MPPLLENPAVMPHLPHDLVTRLQRASSFGVITGAGISEASGIPTYRGRGGIYDDPETGDRTLEALTGETLRTDPDRTWRTVLELARKSAVAHPNGAHDALVHLEDRAERFVLLTQNVDGLHRRAGSRNIIDIHGDVFRTVCMGCSAAGELGDPAALHETPRCPECGGLLRPDVVLFGEFLPDDKVTRLREQLLLDVPEVVIAVGTSAMFPYIVEPVLRARFEGRLTLEINPETTDLSPYVDHRLAEKAHLVLPRLVEALA